MDAAARKHAASFQLDLCGVYTIRRYTRRAKYNSSGKHALEIDMGEWSFRMRIFFR
jgi:hypothetical protein